MGRRPGRRLETSTRAGVARWTWFVHSRRGMGRGSRGLGAGGCQIGSGRCRGRMMLLGSGGVFGDVPLPLFRREGFRGVGEAAEFGDC